MPAINLRLGALPAALALLAVTSSGALAQKKYDIGASDTEIKIGNIMPYSGPASAYGVIGKTAIGHDVADLDFGIGRAGVVFFLRERAAAGRSEYREGSRKGSQSHLDNRHLDLPGLG